MQAKTKKWIKRTLLGSAALLIIGAGLTVYLLKRPPVVWVRIRHSSSTTPRSATTSSRTRAAARSKRGSRAV